MGLPVRLAPGMVSIYGITTTGTTGIIVPTDGSINFGVINKIWDGFPKVATQWSSVMFKTKDILASLTYQSQRYVILNEDNIIATENPEDSVGGA